MQCACGCFYCDERSYEDNYDERTAAPPVSRSAIIFIIILHARPYYLYTHLLFM